MSTQLPYLQLKLPLYRYLMELHRAGVEIITKPIDTDGWMIRVKNHNAADEISKRCAEARVREDAHMELRSNDYIIILDRFSTGQAIQALFDGTVDGNWENA